MSPLSDRLKALGVKVGAQDLPPSPQRMDFSIEHVVPGEIFETDNGPVYTVEQFFPLDYMHGALALQISASLDNLARWANAPQVASLPAPAFAFLDTETSGLAGGTGTYAFLVGAGRFEAGGFRMKQFFMRDPSEEPALLLAIEAYLAPCKALVTFNGKSFDAPLLNARYIMHGWKSPLPDLAHVDLLHLARRLYRDRLPSRSLGNLEVQILDAHRTTEEVPGWMIPQMYFDYLRSGDARPMKNVLYHNLMDVVSMAALLNHLSSLLADPLHASAGQSQDQAALARLFEDLGDDLLAVNLYRQSLENGLPDDAFWETLQRLSFLYKRRSEFDSAIELWQKAASHGMVYAHIELAKLYEHILQDLDLALHWTQSALSLLESGTFSTYERSTYSEELIHRQERLLYKLNKYHQDRV